MAPLTYLKNNGRWLRANWKSVVHILLGTYYFGVNNQWWAHGMASMFGIPVHKRTPRRIFWNWRGARFRAIACCFVPRDRATKLFPYSMRDK